MKKYMSYIFIIFGAFLASFSVAAILLPNDAIDYGTAGIAIILSKISHIQLSLCILIIIIPFLILGFIFLKKEFFFKALIGIIAYTIGIELFENYDIYINTEHFIAVAFGGAILGIGLSIILKNGGCIDGSEILANIIINKLYSKTGRNYNMTSVLIIFNIIVYILAFFVIGKNSAMLSLLVYIVATTIIDQFTNHFEAIKEVKIITKDYTKIVEEIKNTMNKTCTIIDSKGIIDGENKMILCYMSYFELNTLKTIMQKFSGTFYTVSTIDEMNN